MKKKRIHEEGSKDTKEMFFSKKIFYMLKEIEKEDRQNVEREKNIGENTTKKLYPTINNYFLILL